MEEKRENGPVWAPATLSLTARQGYVSVPRAQYHECEPFIILSQRNPWRMGTVAASQRELENGPVETKPCEGSGQQEENTLPTAGPQKPS